ncbi:MAG: hypothetical protein AAFU64_13490 [Bacteroidota bacterium]
MKKEKIVFELDLKEANLIFKALGRLPFEEVYELIGNLNQQANQQLSPKVNRNHFDLEKPKKTSSE